MTTYYVTANQGDLNTGYGDTVYLASNAIISGSINMTGFTDSTGGGRQRITIQGGVFGTISDYGTPTSGGNQVTIGRAGYVNGLYHAIYSDGGGNIITNHGEVSSTGFGTAIQLQGTAGDHQDLPNRIANTGIISASVELSSSSPGSVIFVTGGSATQITNSGSIISTDNRAIFIDGPGGSIVNTGLIQGDVELRGIVGFFFDSRQGTIVLGTLSGGLGNDTIYGSTGDNSIYGNNGDDRLWGHDGDDLLVGGAGADRLDGGSGNDTVDYSGNTQAIVAYLIPGVAAIGGDAQGDILVGIENLIGGSGNDRLIGYTGENLLQGGDGNDTLRGGAGADTLDGGAGMDLADYSDSTAAVLANLSAGTISGGTADGDRLIGIEGIVGGSANDGLTGGNGDNYLYGSGGDDILAGLGGADRLNGGAGADRFVYAGLGQSPAGAGADRISDFTQGQGDRIDLAAIDANSDLSGDQAFAFIGTGAFTGGAGQLRYTTAGGYTTISADANGDKVADLQIILTGTITLVAADFAL